MNNSDILFVSGRNSAQVGCGGSLGNGYVLLVDSTSGSYHTNIKILVGSYIQPNAPWGSQARTFFGWSTNKEISYRSSALIPVQKRPLLSGHLSFMCARYLLFIPLPTVNGTRCDAQTLSSRFLSPLPKFCYWDKFIVNHLD